MNENEKKSSSLTHIIDGRSYAIFMYNIIPEKRERCSVIKLRGGKSSKRQDKKDIIDSGQNPDGELSGLYGEIYEYNSKLIVIYYDSDSIVTNVLISDKQN